MTTENGSDSSSNRERPLLRRLFAPTLKERKRMLRIEAWVFVIASYLLMGFAYLWPPDYHNQSHVYVSMAWTAFMVRTFAYHFGLFLLVMAIVVVWKRIWRLAAAMLPLLLITVGPTWWQYRPKGTPAIAGEEVAVMSVNLLMVNETTGPIIEEIKAARPEILLLQEYTHHWHTALQEAIGGDYPHVAYVAREDSFGAAIYSRRPFVGRVRSDLPLGRGLEPQIRAVVRIADREVAIYNVHLLPPWGMEYTLENRAQFADLLNRLTKEPLPLVLGGDFNFTENSPQAAALRHIGLADAQDLGGWGRGTTWPVKSFFRWIPGLRLDHICLSRSLTCVDCRTGAGQGSDHRPVTAKIGFAE